MENKFVEQAAFAQEPVQDEEAWKRLEGVIASQLQTVAAFWERAGQMAEEEALVTAPSKLAPVLKSAAAKIRQEAEQARPDADFEAAAVGGERAMTGNVARMARLSGLSGSAFEEALAKDLQETSENLSAWQDRMARRLPSASRLQEGLATLKTTLAELRNVR